MNVPAKYRELLYQLTVGVSAIVVVATALGLVDAAAVERGAAAGAAILGLISGVLALKNITPDE